MPTPAQNRSELAIKNHCMSSDTPNPYQSPNFSDLSQQGGQSFGMELNPSILTQQRVIAILMIIQGTLSLLMGLFLLGSAFIFPALLAADVSRQRGPMPPAPGPTPDQLAWILLAAYGAMGLCGVIPGALQIYAGIQNLWLKGHTLGIVAISAGVITIGTCYCLPTSLGLLVYGLIIYLHMTTKMAFQLAKDGHTFDSIMQMAVTRKY
jgi:hypothetical protein